MRWITHSCKCTHDSVMGRKRPRFCDCGNAFVSERVVSTSSVAKESKPRPHSSTLKRGRGFSASPQQQRKVRHLPCVVCGLDRHEAQIHAAHVYPRRFQSCECAEGVVPLCAEHHRLYDDPDQHFDLLRHLVTRDYHLELVHAVAVHHVPIRELLDQVTGVKWEPRKAVAV